MSRTLVDTGIKWIGSLPDTWELTTVNRIFFRRKEVNDAENPTVLSLARDGVKVRDISTNEGQLAESYDNYHKVYKDDLMINPMDLISGANCSLSEVEGVISPAYINLAKKSDIYPKYYDYFFKYQYWINAMFIHGKGVSFDNRWTMNWETMANYKVPFPKYEEQIKIADYLDSKCSKIDDIINDNNMEIDLLDEYMNSLITNTLDGKMIKIEKKGLCKIKYVVNKVGSGKTPLGGASVYSKNGILFLRSQNVYNDGLKLEEPTYITEEIDNSMKSTRVYPNDVLLNITGGSIGRCCIYPDNIGPANVNQHVSIIRVNEDKILPGYMHYFWLSNYGADSINLYQTGGNREGMSADAIKKSHIMLYSIEDQKNIVNYLDNAVIRINKIKEYRKQIIEKLEEYKKSLIYECVTGKREV
ncbi:MAG: restriction endonuclease subunit S [Bacilli bacterium]